MPLKDLCLSRFLGVRLLFSGSVLPRLPTGWLAGLLAGLLAGWLAGWLAGARSPALRPQGFTPSLVPVVVFRRPWLA